MEISFNKRENVIIVHLGGRLDVFSTGEVKNEINSIIQREPDCHFLLDLQNVDYMSSSGVRLCIATMRLLNKNKKELAISGMNESVRNVFEISNLLDSFKIFETEDDALKSFSV